MMKTDCNKVTESKYDNSDERQSSHLQVPSNTSPLKLFLKRSSDMNCRLSQKINLQSIHVYQVDEGNIVNEDVCLWQTENLNKNGQMKHTVNQFSVFKLNKMQWWWKGWLIKENNEGKILNYCLSWVCPGCHSDNTQSTVPESTFFFFFFSIHHAGDDCEFCCFVFVFSFPLTQHFKQVCTLRTALWKHNTVQH